jgi:uncharacterized membrane protein YphA (DoxX/SURF4 family)
MDIQIFVQHLSLTAFRLALALVFLVSALNKLHQPSHFARSVTSYKLLPQAWALPFSLALISAELAVGVLLFLGWLVQSAALVCGGMLVIFIVAAGINLARKRTDLDCGCFGTKHQQKIGLPLIGRNFGLLALTASVILWGGGPLVLPPYLLTELFLPGALTGLGLAILARLTQHLGRLVLLGGMSRVV